MSKTEILSIREFSRRSGINPMTVRRWLHVGILKEGHRIIVGIPASELKRLPDRKNIRALIKQKRARA